MKKQDYANHVRYYAPHHFIFYPLTLLLLGISIRGVFVHTSQRNEWLAISAIVVLLIGISLMLRQHYALTIQNRVVRLELRFRYYTLTQKRLELLEDRLGFGQLAALRFASDEELPALVDRALSEKLSPDEIKKQIRNWKGDHMRV